MLAWNEQYKKKGKLLVKWSILSKGVFEILSSFDSSFELLIVCLLLKRFEEAQHLTNVNHINMNPDTVLGIRDSE